MEDCNSKRLFEIYMSYAKDLRFDEQYFREEDTLIPACPDQFVGKIKDSKNWSCFERAEISEDYGGVTEANGRVVLILESPHRDEYERRNNVLVAQGPACGCTGCKIRRYFNLITKKAYANYELLLLNVIQYPCSLFRSREQQGDRIRDKMIRRLLKCNEFMKCFRSRVKLVMGEHDNLVVINACTWVGKKIINKPLSEILPPNASYATAHHPSIWSESTTLEYHQGGQNGISQ